MHTSHPHSKIEIVSCRRKLSTSPKPKATRNRFREQIENSLVSLRLFVQVNFLGRYHLGSTPRSVNRHAVVGVFLPLLLARLHCYYVCMYYCCCSHLFATSDSQTTKVLSPPSRRYIIYYGLSRGCSLSHGFPERRGYNSLYVKPREMMFLFPVLVCGHTRPPLEPRVDAEPVICYLSCSFLPSLQLFEEVRMSNLETQLTQSLKELIDVSIVRHPRAGAWFCHGPT